jgi:hypothetical protein
VLENHVFADVDSRRDCPRSLEILPQQGHALSGVSIPQDGVLAVTGVVKQRSPRAGALCPG